MLYWPFWRLCDFGEAKLSKLCMIGFKNPYTIFTKYREFKDMPIDKN